MFYGYCDENQPHAVRRIFDDESHQLFDLRWDEAGNLGQVSMGRPGEMFEAGRFLFWTEDNRMHTAVDDRYYSYYAYDHSGERRLKLTGDNKLLDVNADFMATYTILNEPTLYPSAYMVLTNKGYTKHYYAGTERVAARLGGGGLNALYYVIGNNDTLQGKADSLFDQSLEQVNGRILDENNLDCIMQNEFAIEEFGLWIDGIPYQMQAGVELNHDQFKDMVNSMLDDINHGQEKEVYFYHSDHLGSASWITDFEGIAVQHLQYMPYGEPYVNQRISGYSERFTFTGKEKDEETGYGYFGARYMDHELMTMWLSVDPMADKYPSISPYAYCAWNPIKLVDPDGRDVWPTSDEAYQMILGTLPDEAREYVKLNKDGRIDRGLMELYSSNSQNYNDLLEMVKSDCTIEVSLANQYEYLDKNGEIKITDMASTYSNPEIDASFKSNVPELPLDGPYSLSTGETGILGVTEMPEASAYNRSTNENVRVFINNKLSPKGRAENLAHELYGHAFLYVTTGDVTLSIHSPGNVETNMVLRSRISNAQNEVRNIWK
jgi:RHS repeat-associated protein